MELSWVPENGLLWKEEAVREVVQGHRHANQLKTHLEEPFRKDGSISKHHLSVEIMGSVTKSLSCLTHNNNVNAKVQGSGQLDFPRSIDPDIQRKCSRKRRITAKTEVVEREESFELMDDGYMWRKYGAKDIKNHKHPRSYYRCTFSDQGCSARKYVQQTSDHPPIYKTTCFGRHTCGNSAKHSGFVLDCGLVPSNMIRFDSVEDKETLSEMEKTREDVRDKSREEIRSPVEESCPSNDLPGFDQFDLDSFEFDIDGSWLL